MTPDVNVLVAALRQDHPHHTQALQWLEQAMQDAARPQSPVSLGLLGSVVAGFLRIVTHPRIFELPSTSQEASDFIDTLLSCPGVSFLHAGASWPNFRQTCIRHVVTANLVPDAWIAATVAQYGETLCTFDRDFLKLLPPAQLILLTA